MLLRGNIVRGNKMLVPLGGDCPLKLTAEEKLHACRPDCQGYHEILFTCNDTLFSSYFEYYHLFPQKVPICVKFLGDHLEETE